MKQVLLAEDEMLIRVLAEEELAELGFNVTSVASGDEASELLATGAHFDLLVTDIRMPGSTDGWKLGRLAKAALPDLAIIYVTGFSGDTHEPIEGMQVLNKPYRFEQLKAAVEAQIA